ncbi:MAG: phosphate acetyltransferase [Leptospiraceae bacterium]|nr:phosphate acetyltransferase [Leptospiraceae bacterium]MBK9499341.1 phosphate acetyltransferase [Leptospiraceae bacterium]
MSKSLYITTTEPKSGKSLVAMGIMELLKSGVSRVAFFRPIIKNRENGEMDPDINLIRTHYNLQIRYEDTFGMGMDEALTLISEDKQSVLIDTIMAKYRKLEEEYDFVLMEGSDFSGSTSSFEFEINTELAKNLGAPVMLVLPATRKENEDILSDLNLAIESYSNSGCTILGAIVTRVPRDNFIALKDSPEVKSANFPINFIPENDILSTLTMKEIADSLDAEILYGSQYLMRHAYHITVASMRLENFLNHIKDGTLVIVSGDRADIILGGFLCAENKNFPRIMGLVLTGGIRPDDNIKKIIEGLDAHIPVVLTKEDTLRTVYQINSIDSKVASEDKRKISIYLGLFESNVDTKKLKEKMIVYKSKLVTPKMFEFDLIQRAKALKKHIVLPEGIEERILRAAEVLIDRDVVRVTLLGKEKEIKEKIKRLGLKLKDVTIIEPTQSKDFQDYCETYYDLRKHKGITMDNAKDVMSDVSYYGTMMVFKGHADGMVSGSINTTQHTIRPSLEFVKTKPGFSIVSSVFLMCLPDKVLVYGDCAVNPNPTAAELAEIAISSAQTARQFGIEPRVAMLSYSTGDSGKGEEVEKVREATALVRAKMPDILIEGPIQYDAAIDPDVAATKMPNNPVAGKATVFIFPDLNTGNNTYKAVQRSANAVAIGPVLQGLKKPVNDLSRGCTVPDIVNTVVITAIQAQE